MIHIKNKNKKEGKKTEFEIFHISITRQRGREKSGG
jgi:hypothetical protein